MKVIIAIISLLCMIVPTPCRGAECKTDSEANFGQDKTGDSNPLCESLFKQATNMKDAEVCANYKTDRTFIQKILKCGANIPEAHEFSNELSKNDKKFSALNCASQTDKCSKYGGNDFGPLQTEWMNQMRKCLDDSKNISHPYPADNCVSSARPLDCTKQDYLCNVFKEALKDNCNPKDLGGCPKKDKWTTPAQLGACLSELECKSKTTGKTLKNECVKKCYDDHKYDDIKDEEGQLDKLKKKLSACIAKADSNECPVTPAPENNKPAPGGNTAAPVVPPTGNTIKPADQGNDDQKPTSMGPKDQDVTSDEDEGCMVRANKIIIAFATIFVVISFLKALPVEN